MVRAHAADFAAGDLQRGFKNISAEKSPAALDKNVHQDAALRRGAEETSYFARKFSTSRRRKSGNAWRRISWSQSHHASSVSRPATVSGNRRLIVRAGFP